MSKKTKRENKRYQNEHGDSDRNVRHHAQVILENVDEMIHIVWVAVRLFALLFNYVLRARKHETTITIIIILLSSMTWLHYHVIRRLTCACGSCT